MTRYALTLLLLAAPAWADTPAPTPPITDGAVILGPVLTPPTPPPPLPPPTPPPPEPGAATVVPAGRFLPFRAADGSPSYIAPHPAYRIYRVKPGGQWSGIKFDAPAGAEIEEYTWPDEKGIVYILFARNVPGDYSVQLVKNGPAETGPIDNGLPLKVRIGQGPIPPPIPPPTDPFIIALKAAFAAETDPAKASQVLSLAALYKQAAATTVIDPQITTAGQLLLVMQKAVKQIGLPVGALPKVVRVIADELDKTLPKTANTPLDAATRSLIAAAFNRVGAALEVLR